MKIKEIVIENFRSYYGENRFKFSDGLTLIIGANGEGKTNFYKALNWLFDEKAKGGKLNNVCAKALSELMNDSSLSVSVSVTFDHNEKEHYIKRKYRVFKDFEGTIKTSANEYDAVTNDGIQSIPCDAIRLLDNCFNSSIRNYSVLEGEEDLHKLNQPSTLEYLIRNFSSLKVFEHYNKFLSFATEQSKKASDNVATKNAKNKRELERVMSEIDSLNRTISLLEQDRKAEVKKVTDYTAQINELADKKDAIELMQEIQEKKDSLMKKKNDVSKRINENYSFRLLDDLWILCGLKPILDEYSQKIGEFSEKRRKEESIYQRQQGAIGFQKLQLQNGSVPLPLYTPSAKDLQEMLNEQICKVCNRPALRGTPEYRYIEDKLKLFLESLNTKEPDEYFKHRYIQELDKKEGAINSELDFIVGLKDTIKDVIEFNEARKAELEKYNKAIAFEEESERKLLAQVPGASAQTLLNAFTNVNNWFDNRSDAEKNIIRLEKDIEKYQEELQAKEDKKASIAKDSPAQMYVLAHQAISRIQEAFKKSEIRNKQAFIAHLNEVANDYLDKLNVHDFKGNVSLSEGIGGVLSIRLIDNKGVIIEPNKALETTMYMSVLFAVSQLNEDKLGNESPIIFDAPTSSFTTGKENDFFRVVDKLDKQVIVVTKSFLFDLGDNNYVLDTERIKKLNISGDIYRIERRKPYDEKVLSTIQTIITKVPH